MKLWLVEVHEDSFDYGFFASGVVWAESAEEAERLIRESPKIGMPAPPYGERTRLIVKPAPEFGVVHTKRAHQD